MDNNIWNNHYEHIEHHWSFYSTTVTAVSNYHVKEDMVERQIKEKVCPYMEFVPYGIHLINSWLECTTT